MRHKLGEDVDPVSDVYDQALFKGGSSECIEESEGLGDNSLARFLPLDILSQSNIGTGSKYKC
jgi:hypothetical protein